MSTNRRLAAVATASAAGLTGALLAMPAAEAAPSNGAPIPKSCTFSSHGETLRISFFLFVGSNGRDVEAVELHATDNDESGKYDNNDVRIKRIRLIIRDEDGKTQLNNTVSPSSPGSFDVGSAGEGAGKVTVKVRWRTHHNTVNRSCSKVLD